MSINRLSTSKRLLSNLATKSTTATINIVNNNNTNSHLTVRFRCNQQQKQQQQPLNTLHRPIKCLNNSSSTINSKNSPFYQQICNYQSTNTRVLNKEWTNILSKAEKVVGYRIFLSLLRRI